MKAFTTAASGSIAQALPGAPALGARQCFLFGPETARERVWLQCDSAGSPEVAALVIRGCLTALAGEDMNRYRQLSLVRAQFVVVTPLRARLAAILAGGAPLFDAGALGAGHDVLTAMRRFAPTLVVQAQDWGSADAGSADAGGEGDTAGADRAARLRLVETFYLAPDFHRQLATAPRRRWGRPTATARALAAYPEVRFGQQIARYAARMNATLDLATDASLREHDASATAALRLAPGRFTVREEWRRLGGASLCELAFAQCGADGVTAQAFGGAAHERALALLAALEGAVLFRLGLETLEAGR